MTAINFNEMLGKLKNPKLSMFDAAVILNGLKTAGMRQTVLAEAMGKSPSWVSQLINTYRKASPELLAAWRKGEVAWEVVRALAPRPIEEQQRVAADVAAYIKDEDETAELTENIVPQRGDEMLASIRRYQQARKKLSPYLKGVYDALLFARGEKTEGFDKEWALVQKIARRLEKRT